MRYCVRCIIPSTRPNIQFDAGGVCNACTAHGMKPEIDWDERERAFGETVSHAKSRSRGYDCVIPASGGKDSTWQVDLCLKYDLNPLVVTWKPPSRTEIGARNLANLVNLGVDHVDYQVNPKVEKKFLYRALVQYGAAAIPMHMAMYNIPRVVAVKFDIPLVIWGENPAFEYGGSGNERYGFQMDNEWLKTYGVTHGTTARDWICEELTEKEMTPYFGPTNEDLEAKGVLAVFLGYYFWWDPETVLEAARACGFQVREEGPKTGHYNYADIDDDFISVHHYLKWYKFGLTRTYDNLSLEIRNGRMTREEAVQVLRERGDETPLEDIEKFCAFIGITQRHFFEVIERFRNPDIWVRRNGKWRIEGFLIPDWEWT